MKANDPCPDCGTPLDEIPYERCRSHLRYQREVEQREEMAAFNSRLDVMLLDGCESLQELKDWSRRHVLEEPN